MQFIGYAKDIEQRFSYKQVYDFYIVLNKTIPREDTAEPPISSPLG